MLQLLEQVGFLEPRLCLHLHLPNFVALEPPMLLILLPLPLLAQVSSMVEVEVEVLNLVNNKLLSLELSPLVPLVPLLLLVAALAAPRYSLTLLSILYHITRPTGKWGLTSVLITA